MALSGYCDKDFSSGHKVRVSWSATQNVGGNYSTVTATVQLYRAYQWNSTAEKSGYVTINGNTYNFSYAVGGSGWKDLYSTTLNIGHNDNGAQTLSIYCGVGVEVTLSGTWYGTIETSGSWGLDTISRGTYATGWVIWPDNPKSFRSINIFWATAEHPDALYLHVDGGGRISTGQPSNSTQKNGLITASNLQPNVYYNLQLEVVKNGIVSWSPVLTEQTKTGATASKTTASLDVENAIPLSISNGDGANVSLYLGITCKNSSGANQNFYNLCSTNIGVKNGSYSWALTTTQKNLIYTTMRYATSASIYMTVASIVPGESSAFVTRGVSGNSSYYINTSTSKPTLSGHTLTLDATTKNILGDGTNLIQNKSSISYSVAKSSATANKGAILKMLVVKYGGNTANYDLTTGTTTFTRTIDRFSGTGAFVIQSYVVDSRGISSSVLSKTYNVISYRTPVIVPVVTRELASGGKINISFTGSYSRIADKNALSYIKYGYAQFGATPSADTSITGYTSSNASNGVDKSVSYNAPGILTLDQNKNYGFKFVIKDKLGEYVVSADVVDGNPIMRVLETAQVGINCKPNTSDLNTKLFVDGQVWTSKTIYTDADVRCSGTVYGDNITNMQNSVNVLNLNMSTLKSRAGALFDGRVCLNSNTEGGNILLYSPSGTKWEMDGLGNTSFRIFHYVKDHYTKFFYFKDDGNIQDGNGVTTGGLKNSISSLTTRMGNLESSVNNHHASLKWKPSSSGYGLLLWYIINGKACSVFLSGGFTGSISAYGSLTFGSMPNGYKPSLTVRVADSDTPHLCLHIDSNQICLVNNTNSTFNGNGKYINLCATYVAE